MALLSNPECVRKRIDIYESQVLNQYQREAVDILQEESMQPDCFLLPTVEGPPGTGKTLTGAAAVAKKLVTLCELGVGGRYIVLCFTHTACLQFKRALERIGIEKQDAVYLTPYSKDTNFEEGIVGCPPNLGGLQMGVIRWLGNRPVLITTLLGVIRATHAFKGKRVYLMIDEFSQVNAADFFACIRETRDLRPYQFSLLGDPLQLPVVTTQTHLRPNICTFLNPKSRGTSTIGLRIQYRMHRDICAAVNEMRKIFGEFPLVSDPSVEFRTLPELGYSYRPPREKNMREILDPNCPLILIDTSPLGYEDRSRKRPIFPGEATFAARIAVEAAKSYKKDGQPLIARILTPYIAQRDAIASRLPQNLSRKVTTIHKAQGAEYPLVIISFVRSNEQRFVGFLEDGLLAEQVYVGCSRAQAKLIVLMSFDTFIGGGHRMFQALGRAPSARILSARSETIG